MSDAPATLNSWLIEPLDPPVAQAIERLRRAPDVHHVAIMPDVHLATEVCVGTVFATSRLLYPQAVGGDIGCGMLAVAFAGDADVLSDAARAGATLAAIGDAVPSIRRHRAARLKQPDDLATSQLSHPHLQAIHRDEGSLQFGTLGGGNHFIELQADEQRRLWLMIHSGSRAMGQAIRAHHLANAQRVGGGLLARDATTPHGQAYLQDQSWARRYAEANRFAMAEQVIDVIQAILNAKVDWPTRISIDHNHVASEVHFGRPLWIHRKGAMPASDGQAGVLPGSMGTCSYHVVGRGSASGLNSSAHGAGRSLSREAARRQISRRDVHHQLAGVWYDYRLADSLREESPAAYKNIDVVLRAQRDLVRVTRRLRPILNYKGR